LVQRDRRLVAALIVAGLVVAVAFGLLLEQIDRAALRTDAAPASRSEFALRVAIARIEKCRAASGAAITWPHCGHFTRSASADARAAADLADVAAIGLAGKPEWAVAAALSTPAEFAGGCGSFGMPALRRRGSFVLRQSGYPVQAKNWPKRERLSVIGLPHFSHMIVSSPASAASPLAISFVVLHSG
jgi:hypothetical protein